MTSIIVECRQLNNNSKVMSNGDFISTLNENTLLEENDQILIRNGFVDTIPISNEYIELTEDYTLSIQFLYYDYNFSPAGKPRYDNFAYQGLLSDTIVENGQSVNGSVIGNIANLTQKLPVSETDFGIYTAIEFFRANDGKTGNWGDISFEFHYYNVVGTKEIFHGLIPSLSNSEYKTTVNIGKIMCNKSSTPPFLVITPSDLIKGRIITDYNNPAYFTKESIPNNTRVFEPIIGTKSGVIPKGKYAPDEIASRISKIFQEATPSGPFDIEASNNLLIASGTNTTSHKFIMNVNSEIYRDELIAVNNIYNQTTPYPADGKHYNQYVPVYNYALADSKRDYWVGSSQFDVQYDNESNKFYIDYIHTPYYGTASTGIQTNEIITINENDYITPKHASDFPINAYNKRLFYSKANSGIALTSMTSQPAGFWDGICGFNLNNLTVQPKFETLDPNIVNNSEYLLANELSFIPYIDYKEGKNITAPFLINDMSISKDKTFNTVPIKQVGEQLEVVGINSIYADNVILNNVNENAYYLIEIESQFKNNLLTSDFGNMKNVAGIANTYFNSSNFTSTNSADSFIYQHSGEPQMLQSFGIRILDSTKNLASGLGPDNTIFIEIVKAPKIPPQIEDNKEQKQSKGALREQHMSKPKPKS